MLAIPRIKPTLPLKDILAFFLNIFAIKRKSEQEKIISDFEERFAQRYGLTKGVCFSKARIAFYFLLRKMDLRAGGEVVLSAIHVGDFVNMIRLAGFKPVVVDLKKNSYVIDYDDLERKINKNTVLILITHLSGYVTDMDRIREISHRYNIPFIEDCSQALDSYYNGQRLGTFGKAAIFSLSLLKPVCTLSGGMVISSDQELLRHLRQEQDRLNHSRKFPLIAEAIKNIILKMAVNKLLFKWIVFPLMHLTMPFGDYFSKYQKTNKTVVLREKMPKHFLVKFTWQQAVMGLSQLETLDKREKVRSEYGNYLYDNLKSNHFLTLPDKTTGSLNSFWLFPLLTKDTDKLKRFLAGYGIDSSKFLLSCLSEEEAFREFRFTCENAEHIKSHTLFIPMHLGLSKKKMDYIIQVMNKYKD